MIIHKDKNSPEWAISDRSTSVGPGAGAAMGVDSHSVDWCLALFGRPASITAFYRTLRPIESPVEDSFTMILQYGEAAPPIEDVGYSPIIALAPAVRKNLLVTNKTNVYSNMVPLRFVIRGREGSFVKYGEDPQDAQIVAGIMPDDPRFGLEDDTIHGELSTATKVLDSQRKSLLY
jgi:predicted dehydrogenase